MSEIGDNESFLISKEALVEAIRKFRGLKSEYLTLKDRWRFSQKTLENADILPDIFGQGGLDNEIRYYSSLVKRARKQKNEKPSQKSDIFCNRLVSISDANYAIEKTARIVSFVKSAYFQRTDSIDLPYVIAGLPASPERSWGNELYLVAADKLVANYIQYLNFGSRRWDRFVSWSVFRPELHPKQSRLPGGQYIASRKTFHLFLSIDVKYNLQGLQILAHEIGHAACQGVTYKFSGEEWEVVRKALGYVFHIGANLRKMLNRCPGTRHNWETCPIRSMIRPLLDEKVGEEAFYRAMSKLAVSKSIYEGLIDCVALQLAGPTYVKTMKDYVYEPAVARSYPGARSRRLVWNKNFFLGLLLRLSICAGYVNRLEGRLPSPLVERFGLYFERIRTESDLLLKGLVKNGNIRQERCTSLMRCLDCTKDVGAYIGSTMALNCNDLFGSIFVSMKDVSFGTDEDIVEALLEGEALTEVEPRRILDACCELAGRTGKPFWAAGLYSLAFNECENGSKAERLARHQPL